MKWGAPAERETRLRIIVAVAAYAYEYLSTSLMSDADFDQCCREVNLNQPTGNAKMDAWFRANFQPHTGMWVRNHPDISGLNRIANMILEPEPDAGT